MKFSLELGALFTPMDDVTHFNVYSDYIFHTENRDFWMKCWIEDVYKYVKVTLLPERARSIISFRIDGTDSVFFEDIWDDRCQSMIPCEVNKFELVGCLSRCYGVPYDEVLHKVDTYGFKIPDGVEVKIK